MKYKLIGSFLFGIALMFSGASIALGGENITCSTDCNEVRNNVTGYYTLTMVCTASSPAKITGNLTVNGVSLPKPLEEVCTPNPTLNFWWTTPNTILLGQSAILQWNTANATRCEATGSWSGTKTTANTQTVKPTTAGSKSYSLECFNSANVSTGKQTLGLTVNVPDPTLNFSIDDTKILRDDSTTLRWTVDNATYCEASGDAVEWTGPKEHVAGTYNQPVSPKINKNYTLKCHNSAGVWVTETRALTVVQPLTVNVTTGGATTFDIGSNVRWTATALGGEGPYTFTWYGDVSTFPTEPSCVGNKSCIDRLYGSTGSYNSRVTVDDSSPLTPQAEDDQTIVIEDNRVPQ